MACHTMPLPSRHTRLYQYWYKVLCDKVGEQQTFSELFWIHFLYWQTKFFGKFIDLYRSSWPKNPFLVGPNEFFVIPIYFQSLDGYVLLYSRGCILCCIEFCPSNLVIPEQYMCIYRHSLLMSGIGLLPPYDAVYDNELY